MAVSYQFKVQLRGVTKPPVWRRIRIPSHFTTQQLAKTILIAFDWSGDHLWQFEIRNPRGETVGKVSSSVRRPISDLMEAIEGGYKVVLVYDFGDWWEHTLAFEGESDADDPYPILLEAKGAPVPEDIGGAPNFGYLKEGYLRGTLDDEEKEFFESYFGGWGEISPETLSFAIEPEDIAYIRKRLERIHPRPKKA